MNNLDSTFQELESRSGKYKTLENKSQFLDESEVNVLLCHFQRLRRIL